MSAAKRIEYTTCWLRISYWLDNVWPIWFVVEYVLGSYFLSWNVLSMYLRLFPLLLTKSCVKRAKFLSGEPAQTGCIEGGLAKKTAARNGPTNTKNKTKMRHCTKTLSVYTVKKPCRNAPNSDVDNGGAEPKDVGVGIFRPPCRLVSATVVHIGILRSIFYSVSCPHFLW